MVKCKEYFINTKKDGEIVIDKSNFIGGVTTSLVAKLKKGAK